MSVIERLPHFVWRLFRFLPPRLAYSLGLGSIAGRAVLLLTTVGRRSDLPRVTPLLYDEIDGIVYVGSARGAKADWYQNILADPHVELQIKDRRIKALAEAVSDPKRLADFFELRIQRHPRMIKRIMRFEGLPPNHSRADLEEFASNKSLVIIRPDEDEPVGDS